MTQKASPVQSSQRLDKWLWFARFLKSRALATKTIEAGGVRITRDGKTDLVKKPAFAVRVGDIVTLPLPGRVAVIEVVELGVRRGPAPEAQTLYCDRTPEQPRLSKATALSKGPRPTKKDRRSLDKLTKGFSTATKEPE